MATTIRLTTVILSSDSCQTKKQQLSDASSTAVSRADALYFLLHSPFPFLYYIIGYYYITICLC
ncbi:hypothetical protein O1509_14780, partial [Bacteroides ovatus]|nr:hypothetical protein [Bacteroides ovatus]